MKTILFVSSAKFWLENRGNHARTANLYRALCARGYHCCICYLGSLDEADEELLRTCFGNPRIYTLATEIPTNELKPDRGQRETQSRSISKAIPGWHSLGKWTLTQVKRGTRVSRHIARYIRSPESGLLGSYAEKNIYDFYSKAHLEYFRALCKFLKPDYILVAYANLAYLVKGLDKVLAYHPVTLVDTMDVLHERCQWFHSVGERHWISITRKEEKECLDLFDVVIAEQKRDAATFQKMLPGKRILSVGHVSEIISHKFQTKPYVNITYVSSKGPHNTWAIQKFIKSTWPLLSDRFGHQICVHIVGSVCSALHAPSMPDGVILEGVVKDLINIYRDADIVINPVYFGGGLKIKTVEALCHCKPVVTTSVGAYGLEHGIDEAFYVCDDEGSFFERLSRLVIHPNLRQELSEKAYRFARKNFTEQEAFRELFDFLIKVN